MKDSYNNSEDNGDLIRVRHKKEKKERKIRTRRSPDRTEKGKRKSSPRARVRFDLPGGEPDTNGYYIAIADRYRWARYLSFILMVAFLIVMLIFFRENITYDNLMYLAKDLDADTVVNVGAYTDITYEEQYAVSFGMYRQRIASAGTSGFSLYSSTGSRELDYDGTYNTPRLVTGDKYALMYDAGGKNYSLYTTIARVCNATSDEIIEDAAVSDDGSFALVTRSEDSKFLVTVYNSDFKAKTKYYKDTYITDVALSETGDDLIIVSAGVQSSNISAEVMFCRVGTEETQTVKLENTMPLAVRYTSDGRAVLMTDTKIIVFDKADAVGEYSFDGKKPSCFDITGGIVAVSCADNAIGSENTVFVFDTGLNLLYNIPIAEKIERVVSDGTAAVYVVCEENAVRISLSDGTQTTEKTDCTVLDALAAPGSLIICRPDGTTSLFSE